MLPSTFAYTTDAYSHELITLRIKLLKNLFSQEALALNSCCVLSVQLNRVSMVETRSLRSHCERHSKGLAKAVRRLCSKSKGQPVEPFTTLLEVLCNVFHCCPQHLDAVIMKLSCFARRFWETYCRNRNLS